MTFSSIVAIIGGIVTAGCAIAGAIAGIRARKAREAREEELRKAEHEARMARIREAREARLAQSTQVVQQVPVQQPMVQPEVHHYYHNIPQQSYPTNNWQGQNQYMNQGYVKSGYSYGNSYNEPIYAGERAIGNMSKLEMLRQRFYPNTMYQYNYYPQAQYAYAV